eukprot:Lankesteria_metandrocarpae@DN4236_c0_g1_i1.p1
MKPKSGNAKSLHSSVLTEKNFCATVCESRNSLMDDGHDVLLNSSSRNAATSENSDTRGSDGEGVMETCDTVPECVEGTFSDGESGVRRSDVDSETESVCISTINPTTGIMINNYVVGADDRSPASVATTASPRWFGDESQFVTEDRKSHSRDGHNMKMIPHQINNKNASVFTSFLHLPVQTRSWMANTRDRSIWKLCFPATHNSATYHIRAQGALYIFSALIAPFCKCQTLSILDQLYMGIRFLDIRVRRGGHRENFFIFCGHGGILTVPLYEVLKQVCMFLESNPSEVVLLSIRYDIRQSSIHFDCHDVDALVYYYLVDFLGPSVTPEDTVGSMVDRGHNLMYFWNDRERVFPQYGPFGRVAVRKAEKRSAGVSRQRKASVHGCDTKIVDGLNNITGTTFFRGVQRDVCVPQFLSQRRLLSSKKRGVSFEIQSTLSLAAMSDRPIVRDTSEGKRRKSLASVTTAEIRKLVPLLSSSNCGASVESTSGYSGYDKMRSTSSLHYNYVVSRSKSRTLDRRKYMRWSTTPHGWIFDNSKSSSPITFSSSGSRRSSVAMRMDAIPCNTKRRNGGIGSAPPKNTNTINFHKRAASARETPRFRFSEMSNLSDTEVLGNRERRASRGTLHSWKNWIKESVAHHKSELDFFDNKKRLHITQPVKSLSPCFFGRSVIEKSWSSTCDHNPSNLCEKLIRWGNQIESRRDAPYSFRVLAAEVTNPDKRGTALKYWSSQALRLCFGQPVGLDVAADETHELLLKSVLTKELLSVANVVSHDFVNPAVVQRVIDWNMFQN